MRLKDFKATLDRHSNYRFYIKTEDPDCGVVKEEVGVVIQGNAVGVDIGSQSGVQDGITMSVCGCKFQKPFSGALHSFSGKYFPNPSLL